MSKLIAVRLPDNLEETLRGNATASGQTISQIVIQGLEMVLFNVARIDPEIVESVRKDMADHLSASTPIGKRPRHAETCKCLMCKPPKA